MGSMSRHYDVFLSHSGYYKEFVEQLNKELTEYKGFSVFFDKNSIEYGEQLSIFVESARTCKLFVAVLSEEYFTRTKPPMMELAASYPAFKDGRGTLPCLLPVFFAIKPDVAKKPKKQTEWLELWKVWAVNEEMSASKRNRISRVEPNVWQEALVKLLGNYGPVYRPEEHEGNPATFAKDVARIIADKLEKLNNSTVPAKVKGKEVYKVPCPEETVTGHESPAECSSHSQSSDERPASPSAPLPTAGAQSPPPEPQPEPQSRQWDRRLRILVLGDLELVKKVVRHMCGDVESTQVQGHVNLSESRSSSSPVCLYFDTSARGLRVSTDIRSFVAARNKGWYLDEVKGSWKGNKHCEPVGQRLKLFPHSRARLHMVWYVCKTKSDLPSASLIWPEITEKLYGLPVQILVTGEQAPEALKGNYRDIALHGKNWFPSAQKVEELIVKVALTDDEAAKERLLRVCWTAKTRAEIGNAAKTIAWMRKKLGPEGKSDPHGVATRTKKSFSLSQSGELILNYLCTYWDRDSEKLFVVLRETLNWGESSSKVIIKPVRGFVLFCLQAAAIILYSANNPEYGPVPPESLKVEAQTCLVRYFQEPSPAAYDSKDVIQEFLESVFEGQVSVANSLIKKLSAVPEDRSICPCWKMVIKSRSVTPAR